MQCLSPWVHGSAWGLSCTYLQLAKLLNHFIPGFVRGLDLSFQILQVYLHFLLGGNSQCPLFPLVLQLSLQLPYLMDTGFAGG